MIQILCIDEVTFVPKSQTFPGKEGKFFAVFKAETADQGDVWINNV